MEIAVRLVDLPEMQPFLLWGDVLSVAAAVLEKASQQPVATFDLELENVPTFADDRLRLFIDLGGIPAIDRERARNTFETPRLVELAAIAVAGIALYHVGKHSLQVVAWRGSGADYVVDEGKYLLEVAGRSRRRDWKTAWNRRRDRLLGTTTAGFLLLVAEFESPAGKLGFFT